MADADVVPPAPENDVQTNKLIKVRSSGKRIQGAPWRSSSPKLVLPHQLQNMTSRTEADLKYFLEHESLAEERMDVPVLRC